MSEAETIETENKEINNIENNAKNENSKHLYDVGMEEFNIEEDLSESEDEYNIEEDLYKEEVETICVYYVYVNKEKEITNIKRETIFLSDDGILTSKLFKSILKTNSYNSDNGIYVPKNIIKYNFYLDPENIESFLKNSSEIESKYSFMETIKSVQDIQWLPTIGLFYNLNSLHIIYNERKEKKNRTRKNKEKLNVIKKQHKTNERKTQKNMVAFLDLKDEE